MSRCATCGCQVESPFGGKTVIHDTTRCGSLAAPSGSWTWCPMLRTGDLQISLYTDETLEIRDGQSIYAHLTASETADFLRWIDARDKSPNDEMSDCAPLQTSELVRSVSGRSSSPSPCSAIDVAQEWLKKSRQEWNGHISTWTPEQMDNYHRDLGLLVDFVTDCWPNDPSSATASAAVVEREGDDE